MKLFALTVVMMALAVVPLCATVRIIPTTTTVKESTETVSPISVRHLMFDGYSGDILVRYVPTRHVTADLKKIAAYGFTGIVVRADQKSAVRLEAARLHLKVTTKDPATAITSDSFFPSLIDADHQYLVSHINSVELISWGSLKDGIDNGSDLSIRLQGNTLFIKNTAPVPTLAYYRVFISTDGVHLMPLMDLSPSAKSFDFSHYALQVGSYTVFVKAVGMPLVKNHMSNSVLYVK